MKNFLVVLLSVFLLSGCSIKQTVEPADLKEGFNVCIVNNPQVKKDGFLAAIGNALDGKAIAYSVIDASSEKTDCEWKITYTANWAWDMAAYLSYARISVFHEGELDGEAEYDARNGSGRLDKFIDADEKVQELMDQLIQNQQALLRIKTFG